MEQRLRLTNSKYTEIDPVAGRQITVHIVCHHREEDKSSSLVSLMQNFQNRPASTKPARNFRFGPMVSELKSDDILSQSSTSPCRPLIFA